MLLFARAATCPNRGVLLTAFEVYGAGIEAKMNALPVDDSHLEPLRAPPAEMRAAIGWSAPDGRRH